MKSSKYQKFRKLSAPRFKPTHPIHQKNLAQSSTLTQVLLVLVGGLIGIMGNQWFFADNKKLESRLALQQQLAKEKLPFYTRIVNFTKTYRVTHMSNITTNYDIVETRFLDRVMKSDTVKVTSDTVRFTIPSFIIDTNARKEFVNDVNDIVENKDKIDYEVWEKFQDVLVFLDNHPLPVMKGKATTNWAKTSVMNEWRTLLNELYTVAVDKLNNPF